ncbi:AAA family ATPase [Pseudonocardia alaniniphila]|uniref:LuxR C-terminal-related transcriptional regulator n=1 Tax=Pseudonocardia alaniniphila TaxID=75291 RepID=A0ABS9TRS0_9PSEU|nr:helix-turn-helix transcriptional regulator [Pseudonocardia alaniniphila]MCH6171217.1 LuxR C-terminal-related transcriptional regulator [Pseudonocardia alaniniphila]
MLLDRCDEREVLDRLLAVIRAGESRALVVRGELGVGKSALLEYLVSRTSGCRVERVVGVQSELDLAFAGLHQLCLPMLDRAEPLPGPQRDALYAAFGLRVGPAPDRFLVGLAVLGLLAEVARERPLVCVIDDAQWLDTSSVQLLTFVARRLRVESVAVIIAVREPHELDLSGLRELVVGGLPETEARLLLGSALRGRVDERVLDRIVSESRGNPLALMESARSSTVAELDSGLLSVGALPERIEESYLQRVVALPRDTRRLLLLAAAEPIGDPVLLWRAAGLLGLGDRDAAPATQNGLIDIGPVVRFPHPLARSVLYRAASLKERRNSHQALAEVTNPDTDPDRRAWHRAQAAPGPDDEVADELERSAFRARARGCSAAAAAFLEQAAELTVEPSRKAERTVAAAQEKHRAGMTDAAIRLLCLAQAGRLDELQRATTDLLRAQIAFTAHRSSEAPRLLLKAAKRLEPLDAELARETYLEAVSAAMVAGPPADSGGLAEIAEAARAAPLASPPQGAADLLLDAVATRIMDGHAAGMPMTRRALCAFRSPDLPPDEGLRWLWLAGTTAAQVWENETWEALADRHVQLARELGAVVVLPLALTSRIVVHTVLGELPAAASLLKEADEVIEATGSPRMPLAAMLVASWQGRVSAAFRVIDATTAGAVTGSQGVELVTAIWAKALLCNSLTQHEYALSAVDEISHASPIELGLPACGVMVELIEAAALSGQPERAACALGRLTEATRASGTDWALGIEARSRALVSEPEAAEPLYREAIARLGRSRVRGELARAHLLYGEWLRREHRVVDARESLRISHEVFSMIGARAFARRAARELELTGESATRPPRLSPDTDNLLTSQEEQIAGLASAGLTNAEIAARLFVSHRTIEWHLRKVFAKLNITSRRQLRLAPHRFHGSADPQPEEC